MRWYFKDLKFASNRHKRMFVASTPLGEDYMREGVVLSKNRKEKNYYAIALFNNKELVGWAMLDFFLSRKSKQVRTYIYVKTKYRRKGYGTKIINRAKKYAENFCDGIKVCPHTRASKLFFKKANINKKEIVKGYKY